MDFLTNNFKSFWWTVLVFCIGFYLVDRYPELQKAEAQWFDALVLTIWVALCLAPFFNEMELFGLKFKKQIDEVKEHVSEEIASIRNEIKVTTDNNQTMSPQFSFGYPPPPDSQLHNIEEQVKSAIESAMQGFSAPNQSLSQFFVNPDTPDIDILFKARYSIEKELRSIYGFLSEEQRKRPEPIHRLVGTLIKNELIDPNIGHAIREVYSVCSPAIHGEEVSPAQVDFVRSTAPELISALQQISERYA
ncbi:hypothetical protein ACJJIK_02210 [Microbulbifer sp. ZKSA006]|uniref:hypothetical protein n=1 Tax=Microbulbifer sp. ZKSA006 TaxID=3243390 RepID=UPI0040397093